MVDTVGEAKGVKAIVSRLAKKGTDFTGSWIATVLSFLLVFMWVAGGIVKYGFGDSYQNVIGTITNVMTFVMVFFIQHTQNRESKALQIKLDELILKARRADNKLINIEELSEEDLIVIQEKYKQLASQARANKPAEEIMKIQESYNKISEIVEETNS